MTKTVYKDTKVVVRGLHERSFLLFEYFGSGDQVTRAHLPMMSNIKISEDGKANLATYNLLGRAGQLFSYGGADSRKLRLEFELNFLQILELNSTEGFTERLTRTIINKDRATDIKRFTDPNFKGPSSPFDYGPKARQQYLKIIASGREALALQKLLEENDLSRDIPDPPSNDRGARKERDTIVSLMMYWVNLVRSSVLNDSRNTVYGPPLVRLNHGPMFMNSPCIVENYKIDVDKPSMYDVETLMPHTIKITMSLLESRAGNFGKFEKGFGVEGDNITGWESILDENVLDSMNYNTELFDDEFRDDDANDPNEPILNDIGFLPGFDG